MNELINIFPFRWRPPLVTKPPTVFVTPSAPQAVALVPHGRPSWSMELSTNGGFHGPVLNVFFWGYPKP